MSGRRRPVGRTYARRSPVTQRGETKQGMTSRRAASSAPGVEGAFPSEWEIRCQGERTFVQRAVESGSEP